VSTRAAVIDPAVRPGAASVRSLLRVTGRRAEGASLARLPVRPTGALTQPACRAQRGWAGSQSCSTGQLMGRLLTCGRLSLIRPAAPT
jgi:hypothetical protein